MKVRTNRLGFAVVSTRELFSLIVFSTPACLPSLISFVEVRDLRTWRDVVACLVCLQLSVCNKWHPVVGKWMEGNVSYLVGETISKRIFETWNPDPSFNTVDLPFCSLDFMYCKIILRLLSGSYVKHYLV
jgi:hypothetical protein